MRRRTVSVLLIGAFLLLDGCDGAERTSVPDAPVPKAARSHNGYYLQMPPAAKAPGIDVRGGPVIHVTSNLPDDTLAYVTSDRRGSQPHIFLLHRFVGGTLRLRHGDGCFERPAERDRGFNLQVIVVPDVSLIFKGEKAACRNLADCGAGPRQPASVQAVLGTRFERLVGDQVTTIFGTPALVVSAHYAYPEGACRGPFKAPTSFPSNCAVSPASINEDEGGANIEAVADSVAVLIGPGRICELYNFTTQEFRRVTPWPLFRERITTWRHVRTSYAIHRTTFDRGPERVGVLRSPAYLDVNYVIWHGTVARARLIASIGPRGITNWHIADLELL